MNSPCPNKQRQVNSFVYFPDEYHPRGRRDLTPIFELVMESTTMLPITPITQPPTPREFKLEFQFESC